MIITSDLLTNIDSNKIIPIIRQEGTASVPTFLKSKLYVNFSRTDEFEFSYDELVRTIHDAPLYKKPEVANNPFEPVSEGRQEKTGDPVYELMIIVIQSFEAGNDWVLYKDLVGRFGKSRIMLDMIINQAIEKGYVTQNSSTKSIYIQEKGKFYAVEHNLVEV